MNKTHNNPDIIVAQATPYGKSAVAIIRISGAGSKKLVESYLERNLHSGRLMLNTFRTPQFSEHLMAVCFDAPKSYSGEETVELYPHGNMAVCEGIIKTLIEGGARVAERGEFTRRAFLNGKMNLMQCEALADIIDAQTAEQLRYGNKRFDNEYKALVEVEKMLKTALSTVEAILHYGDELEGEEIEYGLNDDVYAALNECVNKLESELKGCAGGKIINDGFKVALIGAPNVGKSTLLNALTGSDRAIVTPIAGTTRDTIDGEYVYNGRKFIVTDTAGLNDKTTDEVEKIGVGRAISAAKNADAVLLVIDKEKNIGLTGKIPAHAAVIMNKCDKTADVGVDYIKAESDGVLQISAKNGVNVTALKQKIFDMCPKDYGSICNDRQLGCVEKCLDCIKAAISESKKAGGLEIVAALLYESYSAILDLYGEQADESVISDVFERFCVGK